MTSGRLPRSHRPSEATIDTIAAADHQPGPPMAGYRRICPQNARAMSTSMPTRKASRVDMSNSMTARKGEHIRSLKHRDPAV
jgi:hypothetical protein